ncbi:hypothetical protein SCB71_18870 [Herbiconiux sp. KACC 21604]|uniref:hypothetical protein n=1 Tax=unclassified Herbiconiux TaxID=2618217 RepID=UPI001491E969|nr:hypothetical protein [Herbiconiux sp. SALV-R1]QJU55112.1 hypothetical protein HL652_16810 [Herbiconiux sp. SALV-R1]WPO86260.1 hypothetical protein SCB71_18870 [Herbiconiux sp. KACC 21604]
MSHRSLTRVGLETSLKPFPSWSEGDLESTAATMFDQWRDLLAAAESAAVLLWISDGSEILEWNLDLDREVTWASSVGFSNTEYGAYPHAVTPDNTAQPFRPDVHPLRYRDIHRLVATIRRVGERMLGVPVTVGATFDPGPEFATSRFKFEEHPEIVAGDDEERLGKLIKMIRANSVLHADERAFAGYPDGVPEGTSFGEFLGRQAASYLAEMGFDYLWLSNGFGFSAYSWTPLGETYNGDEFLSDRVPEVSATLQGFWRAFLRECPFPVEVRGTNFSTGIDLGGDAVPTREIYAAGRFRNPPPNSPWGPLNEDFGIELSGYLSRIAEVPSDGFLFRFYVNDPWFWQNPWWDFYNREPFDIYLPLNVSRLDSRGVVRTASDVQFLSIDTEGGGLDARAGREVSGHVLRALESAPDAAGPVVWVYPFDEYADDAVADPSSVRHPYFEDWYLTAAINAGAPVNTVVSTRSLAAAVAAGSLDGRILVVPTRALRGRVLSLLETLASGRGARVLAYGAADRADERGRSLLGVTLGDGLEGDLSLETTLDSDAVVSGPHPLGRVLRHSSTLSGGPVRETATPDATVLASVRSGSEVRAYATRRGSWAWVRGSSTFDRAPMDDHGFRHSRPLDPREFEEAGAVLGRVLGELGLSCRFTRRDITSRVAVQSLHHHTDATWLNGYLADTTTRVRYRLPLGAPVFTGLEAWYADGHTEYSFGKTLHAEARIFVQQQDAATLTCRELPPYPYSMTRTLKATGFTDAHVTVTVPRTATHVTLLRDDQATLNLIGDPVTPHDVTPDLADGRLTLPHVTGSLVVSWS